MERIFLKVYLTRSYAALRAADLDWIIGPGYSWDGYILEKNQPGTMKNRPPARQPCSHDLTDCGRLKSKVQIV